jgi:hypothetical protein
MPNADIECNSLREIHQIAQNEPYSAKIGRIGVQISRAGRDKTSPLKLRSGRPELPASRNRLKFPRKPPSDGRNPEPPPRPC